MSWWERSWDRRKHGATRESLQIKIPALSLQKRERQGRGTLLASSTQTNSRQEKELSASSSVIHRKVKSGIGREQFCDFAETLGHGGRSQQGIVTLAQILIVHIKKQR